MEQIKSLEQLSAMISAQWKRGVVTNAVLSSEAYQREIRCGTLYAVQGKNALLLLRKRDGFYRLNFYLQPDADLSGCRLPAPTVVEIAARSRDVALKESEKIWACMGFHQLFSRQRMAWIGDESSSFSAGIKIRIAEKEDGPYIMQQLHLNFELQTACLPTSEELEEELAGGDLLLAVSENGERMGAVRLQKKDKSTEVRQVFVDQNHRNKGVASALLKSLKGSCRIWVRTDNLPAMNLYNKLGFATDGWNSTVWIYDKENR